MKFHNSLFRSFLLLGLLAIGAVAPASAQVLAGSDDFSTDSGGASFWGVGERWRSGARTGGDAWWTTANGVLNFTTSTDQTAWLRWNSTATELPNTLANDWTAQITVSNLLNPASGYTSAGIEIYTITEDRFNADLGYDVNANAYYGIFLVNTPGTDGIVTEWGKWSDDIDDFSITSSSMMATGDVTDVVLQLSWTASTSQLTASYSLNGVNFTTGQTFSLAGAEAGYDSPFNNGFTLELVGRSADGAGEVALGQMVYDNMAVSAVPEPSTYAAIAGALMLGFAAWKRRRS